MIASRRRFLFGAGASLLAAPSIVRVAASLMPVKPIWPSLSLVKGYDAINDLQQWQFNVVYGSLKVGDTITISGLPGTYRIAASVTA